MALVLKDRVQETSTTSGTGTLTLSGAVSGFQTFSTAIGNGNTTFYTIYDNTAYVWEVGIGTIGAGTLSRDTVLSNSSGNTSPISLAGNSSSVFCTYPAEKSINYDANGVATIGEVLGYSDTGIIGSFASTVAGYNQVVLQNKSTATNASSNFNVSNDAGTAGSNYAELGINSSTFTGPGSFDIAGASYVASASTDLVLGTYGAYNVHFVTNSNTTDAMTIFNDGGISLGGFANPGIANMAASKFVPGYTAVTSAAGTTVLTEDSNYYQNLLGTTTQTFQLPDATTLLVGTTFIFDNDSTGALTIVDNASGSIDSIPAGGVDYIYLADNSTIAGTWRKHAFIPAAYDFNNTTASFGNATITNAVWNGTTIGTAYGGTGLTSFSAANYALYSTNASTLTAGTLPVAAGGSGATTLTGYVYGNGTSAFTASTTIPSGDISGLGSMATQNANSVAITGGAIDGTTIGATTATTGAFTSVTTPSVTATTNNLTLNPSSTGNIILTQASQGAYGVKLAQDIGTSGNSIRLFMDSSLGISTIYNSGNSILFNTSATIGTSSGNNQFRIAPTGSAVNYVQVTGGATGNEPQVSAQGSDTNVTLQLAAKGANPVKFLTGGSVRQAQVSHTASAVNYINFTGSIATAAPVISVLGTDTNIGLTLTPKGTGTVNVTTAIANTRINPRVLASTANSATPTLNTDSYDMMVITGQSVAITSFTTNLTGTPVNGQKLWISITGTTAIAITWGASFEASTVSLPTTTVTTNRLDVGFVWNVATSTWRCVAVA